MKVSVVRRRPNYSYGFGNFAVQFP